MWDFSSQSKNRTRSLKWMCRVQTTGSPEAPKYPFLNNTYSRSIRTAFHFKSPQYFLICKARSNDNFQPLQISPQEAETQPTKTKIKQSQDVLKSVCSYRLKMRPSSLLSVKSTENLPLFLENEMPFLPKSKTKSSDFSIYRTSSSQTELFSLNIYSTNFPTQPQPLFYFQPLLIFQFPWVTYSRKSIQESCIYRSCASSHSTIFKISSIFSVCIRVSF